VRSCADPWRTPDRKNMKKKKGFTEWKLCTNINNPTSYSPLATCYLEDRNA
jgi:hypothetical protein